MPLIHVLWAPLVDRFHDKNMIVIKNAFPCLLQMSKTSKDFIRLRTTKEVLPKLLSFLKSQAKLSYKKNDNSGYKFTLAYNIQMDILHGIGHLAVNIHLQEHDLWKVIIFIIPYLNSFQPISLQQAAHDALITLSNLDKNSGWFFVKLVYCEENRHQINEVFDRINLFKEHKVQFKKNAIKLMEKFYQDEKLI